MNVRLAIKISIIACVVSFVTALVGGVACLALFILGVHGDMSGVTGVYEPPFIYAGLPIVVSLGFSMAFAHWRLSAARVFAIVSVVVFFGPVVFVVATLSRWGELIGFLVMAALSLFANWRMASLVRRQLENTPNSAVNADAAR